MNLWLDDLRPAPEGWTWVKTIAEAKPYLIREVVEYASLDNDLGENEEEGRKLVLWMAEHGCWPSKGIRVHSANPVAAEYMRHMVSRYAPEHILRDRGFLQSLS